MKEKETNQLEKEEKKREISIFREYFELISEVIIFVFFVNAFLLQTYVIPSSSMEDTMLIGDHLIVDKVAYSKSLGSLDNIFLPQRPLERSMIVTFSGPFEINKGLEAKNLVKRVIALPGDTIRVDRDKTYINGQEISEPYKVYKDRPAMDIFPPDNEYRWHPEFPIKFKNSLVDTPNGKAFLVPQGYYFCMGDNRNHSFDSRSWGPVPEQYIIGKPWRVYWSYESTYNEYMTPGFVHKLKDLFNTIINFYKKTRWKRTLLKY
ncbi:MAG: signal peptidase I [Acidobacteria bacterium]|jgi:signal peptidase I|nr:signal peptidase I [Acidobacteriota bacterium]